MHSSWIEKEAPPLLLQHVNIIEVLDGAVLRDHDLLISHGNFVDIGPHPLVNSNEAHVINVSMEGKYVCPGLIDAHVHLAAPPGEPDLQRTFNMPHDLILLRQPLYAAEILRRGFTTVRDCAGATLELKKLMAESSLPCPRIFISGHALSQTGGHGDLRNAHDHTDLCAVQGISRIGRICDGVAECTKAAREELRCGADFLKIMTGGGVASPTDALENVQFEAEEVRAITAAASNAGKMVTAHAYTPQSIKLAIENGCQGIEHGNLMTPEVAKLMVERGVWLTPTLVTYEAMASEEFLPADLRVKNVTVRKDGLEALDIATQAGVKLCFGTDLLGPLTRWQSKEFELRARVQTSLKVLQSATVNPAEMLGQTGKLGRVQKGYVGDLLVLDANPLEDVKILSEPERHILAIVKDGAVLESRLSELAITER